MPERAASTMAGQVRDLTRSASDLGQHQSAGGGLDSPPRPPTRVVPPTTAAMTKKTPGCPTSP